MIAALFSCDYATCAVPEAYREVFRGFEDRVASADGWDPGALNLAQGFAMKFRTPLVHGDVTRLLIDFARDGDARWSSFSGKLAEGVRAKLEDRHERPYRQMLRQRIEEDLRRHPAVLHLRVRTLAGEDGRVVLETGAGADLAEGIARAWRGRLVSAGVDVRQVGGVAGTDLAAVLAAQFGVERYAAVGLGVSQSFFLEGRPLRWDTVKKVILESLTAVVAEHPLSAPSCPSSGPC